MIKYEDLRDAISSSQIDYFSFITCDNRLYNKIKDGIKNISSFYYVANTAKKYYIEEFTNYNYKNSYNDDNVIIEKGEKAKKYKFVRLCGLNNLSDNLINIISDAALYVFIDNQKNIFNNIYKYMDASNIPYIKIIYSGKYLIDNKYIASPEKLFEYIFNNYYL